MMDMTFWLGADADRVWRDYAEQVEREAEALRHPVEDCPE